MPVYAVTTAKDVNWDHAQDIREQALWEEHGAYNDELVQNGTIIMGGPIGSGIEEDIALVAVVASDAEAARSVFDDDPWKVNRVFRIKSVWPWTVWLDGRS
jgi:uncharacterized protein YciI